MQVCSFECAEVLCTVIVVYNGVKAGLSFVAKNIYEYAGRRSAKRYVCTVPRREEVARDWKSLCSEEFHNVNSWTLLGELSESG